VRNALRVGLWQKGSRLDFKSGVRKYQWAMRLLRAAAGWVMDSSGDSIIDGLHVVPAGA